MVALDPNRWTKGNKLFLPSLHGAAEQQIPAELAETSPQADSPVSIKNNEYEAQSDKLPANPVGSVGSEEVAVSDLNLVPSGLLAWSPLEAQGWKTTAALDAALMPISPVLNLMASGNHTANFRGPAQPSSSMAGSSSHLDSNPEDLLRRTHVLAKYNHQNRLAPAKKSLQVHRISVSARKHIEIINYFNNRATAGPEEEREGEEVGMEPITGHEVEVRACSEGVVPIEAGE